MSSTWKDLYRQAVTQHKPLPHLMAQALDAAENSNSETLRAQFKGWRGMPVYVVCRELDRFGVRAPGESCGN